MATTKRYDSLQVLRALAALGVVAFHTEGDVGKSGWVPHLFQHASRYGEIGVDVFFVISGFVIALVSYGEPRGLASARKFTLARIARIVPLYWALTAFFVALIAIAPSAFGHARLDLWHVITSFLFLAVDQLGRNHRACYQCRLDAPLRSLVLRGVCHCDVHDPSSVDCRRGIPWSDFVAAAGSRVKCAVPRLYEPDSAGIRRWLLPGRLLRQREANFAVGCADCAFGRPRAQKDVCTYAD